MEDSEYLKVYKVTHSQSDEGAVGHTSCSRCKETVHRRSRFCWNCGAFFEEDK